MGQVLAKKGGILFYDADSEWIDIEPARILSYLGDVVVLDKDYTLRDLFEMLEKYSFLQLLEGFTPSYMVEFRNCPSSGCLGDRKINRLELARTIEVSEYEGTKELSATLDFSGVGLPPDDHPFKLKDPLEEIGYGIEFSPLRELLDYPLVLGQASYSVEIGEWTHERFDTFFTLFEFVYGVMCELSYLGDTQDRDEQGRYLDTLVKEVKEAIESGDKSAFVEIDTSDIFDDIRPLKH